MIEWTGALAVLEEPTPDGRLLRRPERLLSRPLPRPLYTPDGQSAVGAITHLSIHGDELRAEGTIRDGLLTPGQPLSVGLDIDECEFHSTGEGVIFTHWRVIGAALLTGHDTPSWPQAVIRAKIKEPK